MRTTPSPLRIAIAGTLLLAAACSDGPTGAGTSPGVVTPAAAPLRVAAIACHADLAARRIACGPAAGGTGVSGDLIVGGQNAYVRLTSSNLAFIDAPGAAERDTMAVDVTVQNLIPQALGTADGTTADPAGVRVFFASGPTATAGAGQVSVANADGKATFLAAQQPYFQYSAPLPTTAVSSPRRWKMAYEPGVATFDFTVYVSAVVQYPTGWVDVGPDTLTLAPAQMAAVAATVRTAIGNVVGDDPVTFASSTGAAMVAGDGTVTGQCGGTSRVGASTATRPARTVATVTVPPPAFTAFSPDPYSAAGNTVGQGADLVASLGYCTVAANGATFVIHSPQTPPGLLGGSYTGAGTGTAAFHHTNPFFAGEEVEATLTAGLVAMPRVARFRIGAGAASGLAAGQVYPAGAATMGVAAGDLNGDGKLDLVTANIDANTVSVLLRNAANSGFDTQSYATAAGPISVAVGDLNGDGRLDIAIGHYRSNFVSVLMRNAANTGFDPRVDYPAAAAPVSVAIGDLNGDGKLDLAVADYLSGGMSVMLRNASNTSYQARTEYPGTESTNAVAIGDLNGDGLMDIAAAGDFVSTVSVYLRNPSNTAFLPTALYGTGNSPTGVAIGDVNGDGRQDLVTANFEETTVSVLLRNAANTGFDTKLDYPVGGKPRFVAIGDINGDGRLDVAAGNYFEGTLSVLLRNAANTGFDAHVDHAVGTNPRGISIADVNGDGRLDLAVGSYGSGTVVVRIGTP